jgi:hypothetical protein
MPGVALRSAPDSASASLVDDLTDFAWTGESNSVSPVVLRESLYYE